MKRLHLPNRPVALLSGLLSCGCCGGKYGIITTERYGCLNHHRRGTCDNNRTITRDKIEARVLTGLGGGWFQRKRLRKPFVAMPRK